MINFMGMECIFDNIYIFSYISANGDRMECKWEKGKKNGHGKFSGKDGRRIIGEWINDEL